MILKVHVFFHILVQTYVLPVRIRKGLVYIHIQSCLAYPQNLRSANTSLIGDE